MVDPLFLWEQQRLARYGISLLLFGFVVVLAEQFRNKLRFDPRAAVILAGILGLYAWRSWQNNPGYTDVLRLIGLLLVLLLPLVICAQLFRELLEVN